MLQNVAKPQDCAASPCSLRRCAASKSARNLRMDGSSWPSTHAHSQNLCQARNLPTPCTIAPLTRKNTPSRPVMPRDAPNPFPTSRTSPLHPSHTVPPLTHPTPRRIPCHAASVQSHLLEQTFGASRLSQSPLPPIFKCEEATKNPSEMLAINASEGYLSRLQR